MLLRFEYLGRIDKKEIEANSVIENKEAVIKGIIEIFEENPGAYILVSNEDKAFIELLDEVEVSYKITSYVTEEEKERLEKDLKELNNPVERLLNLIGKQASRKVFEADPHHAYGVLLQCVKERFDELIELTDGEENSATDRLQDATDDVGDVIESIEEEHGKISGIRGAIGKVLKFIAGVIIGILKFGVQLIGCTGLIIGRTIVTFCKEVKGAYCGMASQYSRKESTNTNPVTE